MNNKIANIFEMCKKVNPVIHCITNMISANDCENAIYAASAYPVITVATQESESVVRNANGLLLNIGIPNDELIESMITAGLKANETGIPIIFDPMGVSLSRYRTQAATRILRRLKIAVLRGNYAEIAFLTGDNVVLKGTKSFNATEYECANVALKAADKFGCVISVSEATDIIADKENVIKIFNGTKLLGKTSGTGSMLSALTAVYSSITSNYLMAASAASAVLSIAGEIAASKLEYETDYGSFKEKLLNELGNMSDTTLKTRLQYLDY